MIIYVAPDQVLKVALFKGRLGSAARTTLSLSECKPDRGHLARESNPILSVSGALFHQAPQGCPVPLFLRGEHTGTSNESVFFRHSWHTAQKPHRPFLLIRLQESTLARSTAISLTNTNTPAKYKKVTKGNFSGGSSLA